MKKYIFYALLPLLVAALFASCDKEEQITPSEITNLTAETTPGRIVLRWNTPKNGNIEYIQVNYYDPLTKIETMRTASIFADSIEIPNTRKKYGEYTFTVKSVSTTGNSSATQQISLTSEAATPVYVSTQIQLTADDLSTNAQEPSEGPIRNLLDDNTSTFFHTAWSVGIAAPHWMQVNLKQEIADGYRFYYAPRGNANNKPTNFDLMGSTNGTEWFLIRNFTREADGLPTTSTDAFTSAIYAVEKPFNQIRIVVNATNNGTVFWTMSEFKFYSVNIQDPEAPAEGD